MIALLYSGNESVFCASYERMIYAGRVATIGFRPESSLPSSLAERSASADQRFSSLRLATTSATLRPVTLATSSSVYRPSMFSSHSPHLQTPRDRAWLAIPSSVRFTRTAVFEQPSFVATSVSVAVPSKAMAAGVQSVLLGIQAIEFGAGWMQ
jgi:hypothetical protein